MHRRFGQTQAERDLIYEAGRLILHKRWTPGQVARAWNERPVPSVTGAPWSGPAVRKIVERAFADELGEPYKLPVRRPARSYLLTGLLECYFCGSDMTGRRRSNGERIYRCSWKDCGRVSVQADPLEEAARERLADFRNRLAIPQCERAEAADELEDERMQLLWLEGRAVVYPASVKFVGADGVSEEKSPRLMYGPTPDGVRVLITRAAKDEFDKVDAWGQERRPRRTKDRLGTMANWSTPPSLHPRWFDDPGVVVETSEAETPEISQG